MGSTVYVTEPVLLQIFSKLPAKSLLRFKCVDKLWCNLICSSEFTSMHFNSDESIHLLVTFCDTDHRVISKLSLGKDTNLCDMDIKLPLFAGDVKIFGFDKIYGSFNGIICLKAMVKGNSIFNVALWNPTIRDIKLIPLCTVYSVGFGFDPKTNDYKIIHMVPLDTRQVQRFEIYSLRNDSWTKLIPTSYVPVNCNWRGITGFSCKDKNTLGWLAKARSPEHDLYIWEIVLFDLSNHEFEIIELPSTLRLHYHQGMLFQYKDSIGLFADHLKPVFEVWVLSDQYDSWNMLFSIKTIDIGSCPGIHVQPMGCWGDGQIVFYDPDNRKLFLYNLLTQEIKHLGDRISSTYQAFEFRRSLINCNTKASLVKKVK